MPCPFAAVFKIPLWSACWSVGRSVGRLVGRSVVGRSTIRVPELWEVSLQKDENFYAMTFVGDLLYVECTRYSCKILLIYAKV
jgi:hypothetical protein